MSDTAKTRQYNFIKYTAYFFKLLLDFLLILFFFYSGLSFGLWGWSAQMAGTTGMARVIYLCALFICLFFIHLPLNWYSGYFIEHKFELGKQTLAGWVGDELKKFFFGSLLTILLVLGMYALIDKASLWWLWSGVFWLLVSFGLAKITPTVIVPLFYKYTQIDNQELKNKIKNLFKQCNVPLKDVFGIEFSKKTKKANAFVCGLGKSRRVVLSDTLVEKFTDEEIEAVVAHELGHYCHRDILKLLLINSVTVLFGLFIVNKIVSSWIGYYANPSLSDISFFPLFAILLLLFSLMVAPLTNLFSRKIEKEADRFSIVQTGKPDVFISMMSKLADMNLAPMRPPKFIEIMLYDHPTIQDRIEFAKQFKSS